VKLYNFDSIKLVQEQGRAIFSCRSVTRPRWFKNNKPTGIGETVWLTGVRTGWLYLELVTQWDSGVYTCLGSRDGNGMVFKDHHLLLVAAG